MPTIPRNGSRPQRACGTMAPDPTRAPRKEQTMTGWAWMAIGATVLAVVIMQIAMRVK